MCAAALRFAPELLLRAQGRGAGMRAAIFDVDGVLTDGRLYIGTEGESFKAFHVLDGHGLKLIAQAGITPCVITGRDSPAVRRRLADLGVGHNGYRRALLAGSRELGGLQLLGALELAGNDGPWAQPENLHKHNAVLRLSDGTPRHGFALTAMAYDARWTATEHVPQRAIDSGHIPVNSKVYYDKAGNPVLINAHLLRTDFRKGSMSM